MKKLASLVAVCFFISLTAFCQEMPKDVPADNDAYDSIQDLVDRGVNVSQGFPDGTFRGDKYTTNYEMAYLMASLALSFRESSSVEVDFSDIDEEISYLRDDVMSVKRDQGAQGDIKYNGSMELRSKFGSAIAYDTDDRWRLGPETNYRLKYSIEKQLGDDASVKLNLDTMDSAFNSSTLRTFATKLIDIEGDLTADIGLENPANIKAVFGPGSVVHRDTGRVAPSDDYTYYARPRPTFTVSTVMGGWNMSTSYAARGVQNNGSVGISEANLQLGRKIGVLPFVGTSEFMSTSRYAFIDFLNPTSLPNDIKQELSLLMTQSKGLSEKILIGSSSTDHPNSQYYLNFEAYLKDLFGRGINVNLLFNSVGMDYRLPFEDLEFIPLNLFSRKILDGTLDMGLEVTAPISSVLSFRSRSELVTDNFGRIDRDIPGSSYTHELSLDYLADKDLTFNSYYRYYFVPSKIDQFLNAVPEASDLVGLGLIYRF